MARKKVGELLRINVSVPLWVVLIIAVLALLGTYFCVPSFRDHTKFLTAVLAGAAAIYTAYYVGAALRLKVERDRQHTCFHIFEQLERPEFVKVRNFLEKEIEGHEHLSASDIYRKVSENQELDDAVTLVLNTFEKVSISIQYDFVDEDILYEYMFVPVTRDYHALRGYIEQLRKDRNCPIDFTELEKLATAWDQGKRLSDGRQAPQLPHS